VNRQKKPDKKSRKKHKKPKKEHKKEKLNVPVGKSKPQRTLKIRTQKKKANSTGVQPSQVEKIWKRPQEKEKQK